MVALGGRVGCRLLPRGQVVGWGSGWLLTPHSLSPHDSYVSINPPRPFYLLSAILIFAWIITCFVTDWRVNFHCDRHAVMNYSIK